MFLSPSRSYSTSSLSFLLSLSFSVFPLFLPLFLSLLLFLNLSLRLSFLLSFLTFFLSLSHFLTLSHSLSLPLFLNFYLSFLLSFSLYFSLSLSSSLFLTLSLSHSLSLCLCECVYTFYRLLSLFSRNRGETYKCKLLSFLDTTPLSLFCTFTLSKPILFFLFRWLTGGKEEKPLKRIAVRYLPLYRLRFFYNFLLFGLI